MEIIQKSAILPGVEIIAAPASMAPVFRILDSSRSSIFEIYTNPPLILYYSGSGKPQEIKADDDITEVFVAIILALVGIENGPPKNKLEGIKLERTEDYLEDLLERIKSLS